VKEVLTEINGGPLGGHLVVNKTLDSQTAEWLAALREQLWEMVLTVTCAVSCGPETKSWGLMHQCSILVPLERTAVIITGMYLEIDRGNQYILIAVDYFIKWPVLCFIPNKEASPMVVFFYCLPFWGLDRVAQ
jgi:hypothetical protein